MWEGGWREGRPEEWMQRLGLVRNERKKERKRERGGKGSSGSRRVLARFPPPKPPHKPFAHHLLSRGGGVVVAAARDPSKPSETSQPVFISLLLARRVSSHSPLPPRLPLRPRPRIHAPHRFITLLPPLLDDLFVNAREPVIVQLPCGLGPPYGRDDEDG